MLGLLSTRCTVEVSFNAPDRLTAQHNYIKPMIPFAPVLILHQDC
jgi:hypothetical protein